MTMKVIQHMIKIFKISMLIDLKKLTADLASFWGAPTAAPRICCQDTEENPIVCKWWQSWKWGHQVL